MTSMKETYGVFQHSSGPQGGYVARPMYDGWAPAPYSKVTPLFVYKRRADAERRADRLTYGPER
jgi:hypothetical protein